MNTFTVNISEEEAFDLEMILQAVALSPGIPDNMRESANHLRLLFAEAEAAADTQEGN